jgi:hypothetical protein
MESVLRLSGLFTEEDGGKTDLGTLEKRLLDKTLNRNNGLTPTKPPSRANSVSQQGVAGGDSRQNTPQHDRSSPVTSDESLKAEEGADGGVEALSDMMCSLVTTNCGDTRYIGM